MTRTTSLIIIVLATCIGAWAQSVIIQGTGAGNVQGIGAGSVKGQVIPVIITTNTYCDGRFEIVSDNPNAVLDTNSNLTWTRDANPGGTKDWTNAAAYCSNLTYAGYSDWRLPSITELSRDDTYGAADGLLDDYPSANSPALPLSHPFTSIQCIYWASNAYDVGNGWAVGTLDGEALADPKVNANCVWPCRGP